MATQINSNLSNWSATAASNQPDGTDYPDLDADLRQIQAVVRQYMRTKGSDMASAATLDLATADGDYIDVTGTTGITSLGTVSAGMRFILQFDDAVTLTHSANLVLPGAANLTTAAGDHLMFESLGGGVWRCVFFAPKNGYAKYTSAGKLAIGISGNGNVNDCVQIGNADVVLPIGISATTHRGIGLRYDTPSTTTTTANGIYININGADSGSVYDTNQFTGLHVDNYVAGTNQNVGTSYGVYLQSQTYGIDNWNLYSQGTTKSFFGGGVVLGNDAHDALMNYEYGEWTPTVLDASLSASEGQTYSVQNGQYTRIGRIVHVTARIVMSSLGTLTAGEQVRIGGLPFTCSGANFGGVVSYATGLNISAGQSVTLQSLSGVARLECKLWDSAAGTTSFLLSELSADGELRFTFTYETDDA